MMHDPADLFTTQFEHRPGSSRDQSPRPGSGRQSPSIQSSHEYSPRPGNSRRSPSTSNLFNYSPRPGSSRQPQSRPSSRGYSSRPGSSRYHTSKPRSSRPYSARSARSRPASTKSRTYFAREVAPHRRPGICAAIFGFMILFIGIMILGVSSAAQYDTNAPMKIVGPLCLCIGGLIIISGFTYQFIKHRRFKKNATVYKASEEKPSTVSHIKVEGSTVFLENKAYSPSIEVIPSQPS